MDIYMAKLMEGYKGVYKECPSDGYRDVFLQALWTCHMDRYRGICICSPQKYYRGVYRASFTEGCRCVFLASLI